MPRISTCFLRSAFLSIPGFFFCFALLHANERPNIILLFSDDMGWSDIGCYGGEIATPNLDRLATGGVRFSQFYNFARCCPSRACLVTGLYPHQTGMGHMEGDYGLDAYRGNINKRCVTFAELLGTAGYSTYMCGKWHLTRFRSKDGPKHNWPLQRGFEKFYGTITGAGSFFDPTTLCRGNTYITPENDPEYQPTPFREYKHWVHEGGISTPLIAYWPRGISVSGWNHEVSHLIDIMPTLVEFSGATYPTKYNGETIQPLEGISLAPAFNGQRLVRGKPVFWEHEGNRAVRYEIDGCDWKLVGKHNKPWELYDVRTDRTETNDLAKMHPARVKELADRWQTWADRVGCVEFGSWKKK